MIRILDNTDREEIDNKISEVKEETTLLKENLNDISEISNNQEVCNYPNTSSLWNNRGLANKYVGMPTISKIECKVNVNVIENYEFIIFDRIENNKPTGIYANINIIPNKTGEQTLSFNLDTEISGDFWIGIKLISETKNKIVITNGIFDDKLQSETYHIPISDTTNDPRWWSASNYYILLKMYSDNSTACDKVARKEINDNKQKIKKIETSVDIKNIPRIILNFEQEDATPSEYYLERQKLIESYGFKACFALSNLFFENDGLTPEQIQRVIELQNSGHDISLRGGVGGRPSDLKDTGDENQKLWDNYIAKAIERAEKIGVFNIIGYQCMDNVIGDALYNSLKKYGFKYARVYRSSDYENDGTDFIKHYKLDGSLTVVNCVGFTNTTTFENIKSHIDTTLENGWDLSIMSHNISDNPSNEQTLKSVYIQTLEYIKKLVDENKVDVVTWRKLYKQNNRVLSEELDYNRIIKKMNWLQTK